ncbi:hypothetical protein MXD62_19555 [Frankia sp. Mgl5]|uniref:hypothetical protein n=1 Tax=Frankia sp. Mgl5 TaxID=2933793 RepID=UPI00200C0502|nr:hypothetical protein [Frankia sp. Mgl5]MCK9929349.1 hypothetical protein [Frankia sp. Mgl5]
MHKIANCTPHDIRLMWSDTPDQIDEHDIDQWTRHVIPAPDGPPARIGEIDLGSQPYEIDGLGTLQIELVEYSHVTDLPPQQEGVLYVVSHMLAVGMPSRGDLLVTYRAVRNRNMTTIGCRLLARPV